MENNEGMQKSNNQLEKRSIIQSSSQAEDLIQTLMLSILLLNNMNKREFCSKCQNQTIIIEIIKTR